ncbi:fused DSP-PTPase phosphatase/NAD kinase-like protein [Nitrospirillum sp. BR 11828]|uniref:fused DSP-PTPase phosphatase/NAD kinase-like protein n=1 Tax=Nitrospirillum sp. BR 11828 TaxID=3104325 RepID=UPI002ACA8F30|nr:sulfur transferase domain-containing protein [Nitrospirillum sp. BR 11828]MDZ5646297.1 sulfur transferase domain-containing protein [Nitrospirillum sp. BR 11828]
MTDYRLQAVTVDKMPAAGTEAPPTPLATPSPAAPTPAGGASPQRISGVKRYLNSFFKDHAFIRMIYKNMFQISPRLYRSSQPTPRHIAQAARLGVRTVINLRGRRDNCGSWVLEDEACARQGLALVNFPVNSRDAPKKHILHQAREIWRDAQYPVLMHCKAGSDRVGFMSVLYLFVHEGVPLRTALGQLSPKYGHLRHAKTGILDHFFETFLAYAEGQGIEPTVDAFYQWVDDVYDPPAFKKTFMTRWWASVLADKVLRRE